MEKVEYFRSQLIPSNPKTVVYWGVASSSFDIKPDKIPEGSTVTDVTYEKHPLSYIKQGNYFNNI